MSAAAPRRLVARERARTRPRPCASRAGAGRCGRPARRRREHRCAACSVMPRREAEAALGAERLVGEVGAPRAGLGRRSRARRTTSASNAFASRGEHARGRRRTCRARRSRPRRRSRARDVAAPSASRPGSTTRNSAAARRAGAASRRSVSRSRTRATEPAASEPTVAERGDASPARTPRRASRPRRVGTARERGLGLGAEDAVLAAGVETERVEPALELARRRRRAASAARGRAGGRRGAKPLSISAPHVSRPQMPSTRSPRRVWNARTASSGLGAEAAVERDRVTTAA